MKQMKKGKDTNLTDVFGKPIHVGDILVGHVKKGGVAKNLYTFQVKGHTKVRLEIEKANFGKVEPYIWSWPNVYPKNCIVVKKYNA